MRIHHLNCGTMRPFGGALVDGAGGGPLRTGRMVCHCLLIETDEGLVLVDTGIGTADVGAPIAGLGAAFVAATRPRLDLDETAVRQVQRLGYAAEDVRHIVLTHLDLDHAGGLADFPWAKVHVSAAEQRAALRPSTTKERGRYRGHQWSHDVDWALYEGAGGEHWYGFDAVRDLDGLPPEILLVPLVGHSVGHSGVAVNTGAGWLLHAGDAFFSWHEADPVRPGSTPILRVFQSIVEYERASRLGNQERLRELVAQHGSEVSVFCAHDAHALDRHVSNEEAGKAIR